VNENANDTDATRGQNAAPSPPTASDQLAELEQLIGELKTQVSALREGEFDAAALEQRLVELNELAGRAAAALDSTTR
jgi:hypothetical protein